ncbi:MAG: homoserine dehydrogenase [Methanomicrobiales archaeon]|nr:homoserine dehydrogenase [Methanomicrobiales archaeon]
MKIALIGFGSVGRGKSGIISAGGIDMRAVLDRKKATGMCGTPGISAWDVITTADYDLLIEVTPTDATTGEPALTYIREALAAGRHVVTSNKGPIAVAFHELSRLAAEKNVQLRYEATVCGAVPIMKALEHGLAGNEIIKISGVFNGTCNYILTRMADEGLTYQQALMEARELGYAEADPTYDVQGIDAAIKLVILANTVWGLSTTLDDVDITGIDSLTLAALELADGQECTIRLIGEIIPKKNILRISPRIMPKNHPLVVSGTLNAVMVDTDMAGEVTLIGKGAGSRETASAIISDVLFIRDYHVKRS